MQNSISQNPVTDVEITDNLKQARELVMFLEEGNVEQADIIINDLCLSRENVMYQDLGKLTRELHETMNDINSDSRLSDIMNNEMPDARHNLDHVITLTEDAANQTLSAAEHSSSLLSGLSEQALYLHRLSQERIKKLAKNSELSFIDEELKCFLDKVDVDVKDINKDISDIIAAQAYQDLSGQIIQRVSKMVHDVEDSLVGILKVNSANSEKNHREDTKNNSGYGPAVPGIEKGEVINNQGDVDDLLSTLGF